VKIGLRKGLSENTVHTVRYVSKVGAITKTCWYENFGYGSKRWMQMQLQDLVKRKILKYHSCDVLSEALVLDEKGMELVMNEKWKYVASIPPQFIKHDEVAGIGVWNLERAGICQKWVTERELKSQMANSFKLQVKEIGVKYPDITMKLSDSYSGSRIAVEYERTPKTTWRYQNLLRAYERTNEFNRILFIVQNDSIESRLKLAMKKNGNLNLNSTIDFARTEVWEKNIKSIFKPEFN